MLRTHAANTFGEPLRGSLITTHVVFVQVLQNDGFNPIPVGKTRCVTACSWFSAVDMHFDDVARSISFNRNLDWRKIVHAVVTV